MGSTLKETTYSTLTKTSIMTSTTISIPEPVIMADTLTSTTATTDRTTETVYGSLMVVFLALFLAALFLL